MILNKKSRIIVTQFLKINT